MPYRWATCWSENELTEQDFNTVKELISNQDFSTALLLSAPNLLKRYPALLAKGFNELNKHDRQTIRKLVQFAARAAAKISPFSSFGRVHPATFLPTFASREKPVYQHVGNVNKLTIDRLVSHKGFYPEDQFIAHKDYYFDDLGNLYWLH